jgi:hypothetical protein
LSRDVRQFIRTAKLLLFDHESRLRDVEKGEEEGDDS